mgnify:CR=1 FL=1
MQIYPITSQNTNKVNFNGICNFRFNESGISVLEKDWPEDYILKRTKQLVKVPVKRYQKSGKGKPKEEMSLMERITLQAHYFVSYLWSDGKREGTKHIQEVVSKSLKDSRTDGRVILDAQMIDGKTSPAGFYYKLGFRFANNTYNKILANWLKRSGKKFDAPSVTGVMYLPEEYIEHCLRY